MIVELICLVFLAFFIYLMYLEYDTSKYPPGPRPWPFIGNVSLMKTTQLSLELTKLREKYGDVFTVFFGPQPMVVVSGMAIKESLVEQSIAFASRPPMKNVAAIKTKADPTLFMLPYGPKWRLFRKMGHQSIKVYGQDRLQSVMDSECEDLCRLLKQSQGKPIDVCTEFSISVTNVICHQVFGKRYDHDDPELLQLFKVNDAIVHTPLGKRSVLRSLPLLKHILPVPQEMQARYEMAKWRDDLMSRVYEEHLQTFDPENIRDYTDGLIKAKLDAEQEDSSSKQYLKPVDIHRAGMATVFLAGSETTSTTLGWAVRYLLHYPEVQSRLHQEIDNVLYADEVPKLDHKRSLPLLESFMTETLRMSSILPLDIPHQTTTDVTLRGYTIPKDATVIVNLWALHYDPKLWPEPYKFSLDRHLDEDGQFVSPPNGTFYPFSAGRRVCMGEVFARSELFLFLAKLVQKFRFESPPGVGLPSLERGEGIVVASKPFQVCVISRH